MWYGFVLLKAFYRNLLFMLKEYTFINISKFLNRKVYIVHISIIYMENKEEAKKRLEELGIEEVIQSEVKTFGTSAHIIVPKKHIGKKITILINKR